MFRSIGFSKIWRKTTSFRLISSDFITNDEELYATLLRRFAETKNFHHGRALHAKLVKGPLNGSLFLNNHILNMYAKSGHLLHAHRMFDHLPQRNVVSWSALIAGFVQHNRPSYALVLFSNMQAAGVNINEFTLVSALHACSLYENDNDSDGDNNEEYYCSYYLSRLYQVYAFVVRLGFEWNVFLMNVFMTALIRGRKLAEALKVFEGCRNKDTVSWNAVMAGLAQFCCGEVPGFWRRMCCEGVKPDSFAFSGVLAGLAALGDGTGMGMQVHGQLVKCGHGDEVCVGNSLVDMYLKSGSLEEGIRTFDEMAERNVCTWNQMAAGCLNCGKPGKALEFINEMRKTGVRMNKFTLATALTACANLASLEEGKKAHGLRIKLENDVDVCVDNALLDMYAKCGSMDDALQVFGTMEAPSVVSWTTMIMGFAQNGQERKALEIFDEMRAEDKAPNYITFICVLYACSQGGLINEGWEYFSSMEQDHGISPGEDHYACMVDMLGRAGRIKEAYELIRRMPFQAGVMVWQTLLGACRVHGDVETGLIAAKQALSLDKDDSSTYVVLSNMFADGRNWKGVGSLRELMETRDVKKMPGSSWIQLSRR